MKTNLINHLIKIVYKSIYVIVIFAGIISNQTTAQVIKSFVQRPANATPTKLIYNIKSNLRVILP